MDIKTLKAVGEKFRLPGTVYSFRLITNGNINTTYKVTYKQGKSVKSYLFQRVNTYVFKEPSEIMENIDRVTRHIREKNPDKVSLHFHHIDTGENYYTDRSASFWRVTNYVDAVTYNTAEDLRIVKNTGKAFGEFQHQLSDFDASTLHETIKDFHNTEKRLEALFENAAKDPCGRASEVSEELDYIRSVKKTATLLSGMYERGEIPPRVTHNDTKSNNVLFDKRTKEPLLVIDLDTVMPGIAMYDFGDGARFIASTAVEDEPDLDNVSLDIEKFRAFAEGFIPCVKESLTQTEIDNMVLGVFSITIELAARFLDDYITGDKYFKTCYEGHNLVRARCQLKLAQDMYEKREQMIKIVKEI
ncbi:MAG: aminoglycoside phosphotransferase family protein [Clostridia bacterium]|nr:aminoglycoside phosphotransferase family protein [Clostridia bacterium]